MQHLGHEPLRIVARVKARIVLVPRERHAAALVGLALQNLPHQSTQVVAIVAQPFCGGGKERLVARRVRLADIVHRLDQSDAEEIRPHAVRDRAREIRILRGGQPIHERLATVAGKILRERLSRERTRHLRFARERLHKVAVIRGEHDAVAIAASAIFEPHPSEQIGVAVVVVVRPLLHRVIVAARAIRRDAEESHRSLLRKVAWVGRDHEVIRRAILQRAPARHQQTSRELIPRRVRRHLVADPFVIRPHRRHRQLALRHEQQVAPLVGPVVRELRPLQHLLDHAVALARARVSLIRDKRAHLARGRQHADRVEIDTPQKFLIRAAHRRRDVQLAQFFQHEVINPVPPRRTRERLRCHVIFKRRLHRRERDLLQKPRSHRALPVPDHRHFAEVVHIHHRLIRRRIFRIARHVLAVSVGKMRLHRKLPRLPRLQPQRRWQNLDALDPHVVLLRPQRALRHPLHQRLPLRRMQLKPLTALVRHRRRRLHQQQRARGILRIHPPPERPAREREIIALRVIPAQRKLESPLPRRRPVASPRRTPRLREDRLHMIAKRNLRTTQGQRQHRGKCEREENGEQSLHGEGRYAKHANLGRQGADHPSPPTAGGAQ